MFTTAVDMQKYLTYVENTFYFCKAVQLSTKIRKVWKDIFRWNLLIINRRVISESDTVIWFNVKLPKPYMWSGLYERQTGLKSAGRTSSFGIKT